MISSVLCSQKIKNHPNLFVQTFYIEKIGEYNDQPCQRVEDGQDETFLAKPINSY